MECAAIQDVLVAGKVLASEENHKRKIDLDRIAAMLSRLGGRGYSIREDSASYISPEFDSDKDFDSDF